MTDSTHPLLAGRLVEQAVAPNITGFESPGKTPEVHAKGAIRGETSVIVAGAEPLLNTPTHCEIGVPAVPKSMGRCS